MHLPVSQPKHYHIKFTPAEREAVAEVVTRGLPSLTNKITVIAQSIDSPVYRNMPEGKITREELETLITFAGNLQTALAKLNK